MGAAARPSIEPRGDGTASHGQQPEPGLVVGRPVRPAAERRAGAGRGHPSHHDGHRLARRRDPALDDGAVGHRLCGPHPRPAGAARHLVRRQLPPGDGNDRDADRRLHAAEFQGTLARAARDPGAAPAQCRTGDRAERRKRTQSLGPPDRRRSRGGAHALLRFGQPRPAPAAQRDGAAGADAAHGQHTAAGAGALRAAGGLRRRHDRRGGRPARHHARRCRIDQPAMVALRHRRAAARLLPAAPGRGRGQGADVRAGHRPRHRPQRPRLAHARAHQPAGERHPLHAQGHGAHRRRGRQRPVAAGHRRHRHRRHARAPAAHLRRVLSNR
ncbi:hypothetical protein D9M68_422470 [compost metagenome]